MNWNKSAYNSARVHRVLRRKAMAIRINLKRDITITYGSGNLSTKIDIND